MSSAIKIIVVLVVVAGGAWVVMWSGWLPKSQPTVATPQPVATTTPTPPPPPPPDMNGMSAASDSSDVAFAQDVAAIDAQLQGLGTDMASYDATITDKPTPQAY